MRSFLRTSAARLKRVARKELFSLVPYRGGKSLDELERETGRRDFIKLASNENALGPSPKALSAMRRALAEAHFYPEMGYPLLKAGLARRFGLSSANVILGDGSNEILVLAAWAFLKRGDNAVMPSPSFAVFRHVVTAAGARPVTVPLRNYRHDLAAMAKAVNSRTRVVFICNPNNPTGTAVGGGEVTRFLRDLPGGVLCVFDEAYAEFAERGKCADSLPYVKRNLGVLTVRTFAKLHGLAGLRIGYGLGPRAVIATLERLRQPFNVNAIAYRGAIAALQDRRHVRRTCALVTVERRRLAEALGASGFEVVPSQANFLLVGLGMSGAAAAGRLLKKGIIVRPLMSKALRDHVRVTIGTRRQNRRVLRAMRELRKAKIRG